jgi:hypothetical protein
MEVRAKKYDEEERMRLEVYFRVERILLMLFSRQREKTRLRGFVFFDGHFSSRKKKGPENLGSWEGKYSQAYDY